MQNHVECPILGCGKMNQSNYWDMVLFTHCQIKTVAVLHSHTPNRDIYFVGWTTLSMAIKYIIIPITKLGLTACKVAYRGIWYKG